jgi:hypothetical protein
MHQHIQLLDPALQRLGAVGQYQTGRHLAGPMQYVYQILGQKRLATGERKLLDAKCAGFVDKGLDVCQTQQLQAIVTGL